MYIEQNTMKKLNTKENLRPYKSDSTSISIHTKIDYKKHTRKL